MPTITSGAAMAKERPFGRRDADQRALQARGTQVGDFEARLELCERAQVGKQIADDIERITPACGEVVDTAHHHRAAQAPRAQCDLFARQPHRSLDAAIEGPLSLVMAHMAAEGESKKGALPLGLFPVVD